MPAMPAQTWWFKPALIVLVTVLLLWLGYVNSEVQAVVLATDALLGLLLVGLVFLVAYIRQRPELLSPWQQVSKRRIPVAAAVILLSYAVIALIDSVHFREPLEGTGQASEVHYSFEVSSLLDLLLVRQRNQQESTFSAPFALRLYSKEMIEQADGKMVRDYPRLQYGGAHLQHMDERAADIAWLSLEGLLKGALLWSGLLVLIVLRRMRAKRTTFSLAWQALWRDPASRMMRTALITFLLVILLASVAMQLGSVYHILGTSKVGQDVFYQAVKSIRTGLIIGTLTTLVMLPFAILMGIAAGYFRGWIDDVIQYIYTTLNSIPGVLLIAAAILSIQVYISNNPELFETAADRADLRLLALVLILGVTSWTGLCRLLRGEALKIREMEYIQAARAFGVSPISVLGRHILPNVLHIVLIIVVLDFSGLVLAEAVLAYVGVGVDPSTISWGNMINSARLEMAREPLVWWSLLAAFFFMFALVLAANLFADAVRDAFDPRMRTS